MGSRRGGDDPLFWVYDLYDGYAMPYPVFCPYGRDGDPTHRELMGWSSFHGLPGDRYVATWLVRDQVRHTITVQRWVPDDKGEPTVIEDGMLLRTHVERGEAGPLPLPSSLTRSVSTWPPGDPSHVPGPECLRAGHLCTPACQSTDVPGFAVSPG